MSARTAAATAAGRAAAPVFDYFVVLDFEAAFNQPDGPGKVMEVIELPSVVVNARTLAVETEFQRYCRPVLHPRMHPMVTEITGITQATVDAAEPFPAVFAEYRRWLLESALSPIPPSADSRTGVPHPRSRSFAFVTCGDWDIKTMFPVQFRNDGGVAALVKGEADAAAHQRYVEAMTAQWINLKDVFNAAFPSARITGMTGMLELPLVGRHHSGIDDCRNIAAVLRELLRRGVPVDITNTRACVGGAMSNSQRHAAIRNGSTATLPGRLPTFTGDTALPFASPTLVDRAPVSSTAQAKAHTAAPAAAQASAAVPQGPPGANVAAAAPKPKRASKKRLQ